MGKVDFVGGLIIGATSLALAAVAVQDPRPLAELSWATMRLAQQAAPSMAEVRVEGSMGSGWVWDRSGLVVTAAHVVGDHRFATVTIGGVETPAIVLGADHDADVAVLRLFVEVAALPLPRAAAPPPIGTLVFALGSPFELGGSVTLGFSSEPDDGFLIHTANLNPGNSGGPLVNAACEVVGMNTQVRIHIWGAGVSKAVPIAKVKEVVDELVRDPWQGQAGGLVR